ncbi:hypothetical protein ACFE04_004003 [Oxalis oulophora]
MEAASAAAAPPLPFPLEDLEEEEAATNSNNGGSLRRDHFGDDNKKRFETAEKIILRWDSTASEEARDRMIFESSNRDEVDRYLNAVDEIQRSLSNTTINININTNIITMTHDAASNNNNNNNNNNNHNHNHNHNNIDTIQIAMARLEDEFRNILITHTVPLEPDSLHSCSSFTSNPLASSSSSSIHSAAQDFDDDDDDVTDTVVSYDDNTNTNSHNINDDGIGIGIGIGIGSSNYYTSTSSYRSTPSISISISIREIHLIPDEAIMDLQAIARRMISSSYFRECIQVYASVRKSALDSTFPTLGIEKLSIGDIQRLNWDALELKIKRWIRAAKLCIRVLFSSEKKLCQQIFHGLGGPATALDDACFMETVKGPAIQLFNFAEAISISRRSPEKLFKILDLHDCLLDLLPDIDLVFASKSSDSIRVQAAEILSRLGEAARGILSEFENAVLREPSRVPGGGTIHPLTRYVMNYISLISDYKQTLLELIMSKPSTGSRYSGDRSVPDMAFADLENKSALAVHLIWITVILETNLEEKSKHYKDASLAHLFMMNNVHYIVQKVKGTPELREMIGDDHLKRLTGRFRQSATSYQRATWVNVLYCLRDEGLHVTGSFSSGVSKSVLRERFKSFNAMFEEVHRTQALWLIPDTQLREELRINISELLIPAYRSFLGRFRSHIENGKHPENYIKHSAEDLESAVLDFFEGFPVSQHLRRRSQ